LNGHTPFSAIVAFVSYLCAYLSLKKYNSIFNLNQDWFKNWQEWKDLCRELNCPRHRGAEVLEGRQGGEGDLRGV
jgi:hypothetical protein